MFAVFMRTKGRSDERDPWTICEHDQDSPLGDNFIKSAHLYSRV